jgi:hypothetical protein
MKNYLLIIFLTLTLSSYSQSISFVGNYPLIHKTEYTGIIDIQVQWNFLYSKNYKWEFGITLDYLAFNNVNSNNSDIYIASINFENNILDLTGALGMKLSGSAGYYYELEQNGLALSAGIIFDRVIFKQTHFLVSIKENMLIDNFNYLNFGIGIRRNF